MLKIEKIETYGWESAIRGMRNPKNSWVKTDSDFTSPVPTLGKNDLKLTQTLANAGQVHGKFLRMIVVTLDITAPMYWWTEFDTYKVGTVRNSCSKMHKLLSKPFEMGDFSFEKVPNWAKFGIADSLVFNLNTMRDMCLNSEDADEKKQLWYAILQLLPDSYNQKSTIMLNYAVLKSMYEYRHDHKLDEWHTFCDLIATLPYAKELIIGNKEGQSNV